MIIINIFNDYMYNIDIIIKSSLGGIILFEELIVNELNNKGMKIIK